MLHVIQSRLDWHDGFFDLLSYEAPSILDPSLDETIDDSDDDDSNQELASKSKENENSTPFGQRILLA